MRDSFPVLPYLLLLLSFTTFAQRPSNTEPETIYITGTVIDQETGQPLEYATLVITECRRPQCRKRRHYGHRWKI